MTWASASKSVSRSLRLAVVPQGPGDLMGEPVVEAVDQVADVVADVPHVEVLAAAEARVEDLAEVGQDLDDLAIAGQGRMAEVVDPAALLVRPDDPLGELGQRLLEPKVGGHAFPRISPIEPAGCPAAEIRRWRRGAPRISRSSVSSSQAIVENAVHGSNLRHADREARD